MLKRHNMDSISNGEQRLTHMMCEAYLLRYCWIFLCRRRRPSIGSFYLKLANTTLRIWDYHNTGGTVTFPWPLVVIYVKWGNDPAVLSWLNYTGRDWSWLFLRPSVSSVTRWSNTPGGRVCSWFESKAWTTLWNREHNKTVHISSEIINLWNF